MSYSVCVIDNDIPAAGAEEWGINDTALLNTSNLQLLLQRAKWEDEVIKNLITTLMGEKASDGVSSRWEVYGFTNPSFYVNAINDGFFRADLIVFDWEYPGAQNATETNPESILREILERTFCLIFIFSKADKGPEIEAILAKPEFQVFKERIQYLDKAVNDVDQTSILLRKSDEMYARNFSFKFAGVLRRRSAQCADRILSDMGRASLNDVKNLLAVGHTGKKDFIDFLAERFRTSIADRTIYDLIDGIPPATTSSSAADVALASKVWSYRLYFQPEPGDELVRRGDIVAVGAEVLMVLSADCDLVRFWSKNFGIINAVSLHELDQANTSLKELLTLCAMPDLRKPPNSLLGKLGNLSEGPFVLPFVPAGQPFKNFIAIPKDLVSKRIETPSGWNDLGNARKDHPMKYGYWKGAQRLCTISEPFLTPVIQHVFNTLGGNGVPDYPPEMKAILKTILDDFNVKPSIIQVAAGGASAQSISVVVVTPDEGVAASLAEGDTTIAASTADRPQRLENPTPIEISAEEATNSKLGEAPTTIAGTSVPSELPE